MRALYFAAALAIASTAAAEPTLVGYARLPADTFRPGPTSGQFIEGANGRLPPFVDQQPVQGISSVVATDAPGTYLALSDNGFGAKANSADYVLCVYEVTPDFEAGEVAWSLAFELSDPDRKAGFPTVADLETYPGSEIPVPAEVREKRLLTGADFDVESMVRLPDGTFWVGDEFGPFLLHFDAQGRLMEEPVELPGKALGEVMVSPDHPTKNAAQHNVPSSRGIEGMALLRSPLPNVNVGRRPGEPRTVMVEGDRLVPMLEGSLVNSAWDPEWRHAWRYNTESRRFEPHGWFSWFHHVVEPPDLAIGEVAAVKDDGSALVVIHRDSMQGEQANDKWLRLLLPNSPIADDDGEPGDGTVLVRPLADLLDLADPDDLDGDGRDRFRFPYLTIESVLPVDERTVLVVNDNNYPFTDGRPERDGPDDTEFILIRFDRPLAELGEGAV